MLYALNEKNEKVEPTSKARAKCPFCKLTVIACTGEIKYKYWRHEQQAPTSCIAAQYENEGPWHATWKRMFGAEFAEIYCEAGRQTRKADVKLKNGLVIEIQHSSIDSREIKAREAFHNKMVWIFDATGPFAAGRLKYEKNYFFWEQPRLSIKKCTCPVFIEADYGILLELTEYYLENTPKEDWQDWEKKAFRGKCNVFNREEFKKKMEYTDVALKDTKPKINVSFKQQFSEIKPSTQLTIF